jgi:opacity protein-like surface antigen
MGARILTLGVMVATLATAQPARADWFLTPFAGVTASGRTGYFDPDAAVSRTKPVVGTALTRTWRRFAAEGELALVPNFFTAGDGGLITSSSLLSLSGNAIVNLPSLAGVTPYAVAGAGVVRVQIRHTADVFSVSEWQPVLNVGAGLLVPVAGRFSLRGDARYTLSRRGEGADSSIGFGQTYVDLWRVTAGLAIALR